MKKKLTYKGVIGEVFALTGAVAIIAAAVYFFLVPSHTTVSSISGLGIILTNFIPLPLSVITMILNVILLLIGFITCGKEFGMKTVYTSISLPVFIGIFERIFPNIESLTNSQELDVLCYVLVVSVGLSILFNMNASSGGLDIVAKIMNKYLHIELGRAMSLSGMCVALSAALVYDKKTVVLSILGTYFNQHCGRSLYLWSESETASLPHYEIMRKNYGDLFFMNCTVEQQFMSRSVLTTWKRGMRSLPLWIRMNIRN